MAKKARMGRNLNALLGGASQGATGAASDTTVTGPATVSAEGAGVDDPTRPGAGQTAPEVDGSGNAQPVDAAPGQTAASGADRPAGMPTATVATPSADGGQAPAQAGTRPENEGDLRSIDIARISRGIFQPRRHFDETQLQELADSISAQGLIQPVVVRPYAGGYELVAGERRWRAAQLAGLTAIPALIRVLDDRSVAAMALIENIQRKDLNPLEEAAALARLSEEFGMTHRGVAQAVGRSRAAVSNLLRLLELPEPVKAQIDAGQLDMGHARALLGAPDSEQVGLARRIVDQGLSVRAVEALVKQARHADTQSGADAALEPSDRDIVQDPDIERLGQKLGETLGAPVKIAHRRGGAGKLEIRYTSVEELEGILAHIQ